jgi:hypothetical protein
MVAAPSDFLKPKAAQQPPDTVLPVLRPPARPTPPTKPVRNRRSEDVGLTGEVPTKAVPNPTESTHCGDVVVRPWVASTVRARAPAIR